MSDLATLHLEIKAEAEREPFPLDQSVYEEVGKEPTQPILYTGNLASRLCFFGRDLGKDEVKAGQPLYGAAGTLVRKGFYTALYGQEVEDKQELGKVCDRLLLTNTVPYKPPGNKAYSANVKNRFRPFLERLLVFHWQGNQIITLGNEAFKWFIPYGEKGELTAFFRRKDRYQESLQVTMAAEEEGEKHQKIVRLLPLPHPSPLNQTYYAKFPAMLQQRLKELDF